jgi:twinkle protein
MNHEGSEFVRHIPCDECGSRDNAGLFSDNHTYCFGCGHHTKGDGSTPSIGRKRVEGLLHGVEIIPLMKRSISEETAKTFGYGVVEYRGEPVQVAPYFDADGTLIAQKIRTADKQIRWLGDPADALPFGAHAWQKTGRKIVVTEGEIDALSVSQVLGNTWPVVSIGCGAGAQIRKYMAKHRDYFNGFDEVVLMFDMDEPGREAVAVAAEVIGPKAKIATLPLKDANEMLVAGKVKELVDATWRAKKYAPEGIVELSEIRERVMAPRTMGLSYPWDSLTNLTYGIRTGRLIAIAGAAGGGKTDVITEMVTHMVNVHGEKVGVFALEQSVQDTGLRLCGKVGNKRFHIPDGSWEPAELETAWDNLLNAGGKVFLYDSFGVNEYEAIESRIRHLRHAEDVRYFFLDHLTALATTKDDERKELDQIMGRLGSLVKELDITVWFVSHLATPEGTPHEEGGRVMLRHLRGSRSIAYWCESAWGIERNQQAEDLDTRNTATVRCLKDREGGNVGEVFHLRYNKATGRLLEGAAPTPEAAGFTAVANTDF